VHLRPRYIEFLEENVGHLAVIVLAGVHEYFG
jgi:hypothetical protein